MTAGKPAGSVRCATHFFASVRNSPRFCALRGILSAVLVAFLSWGAFADICVGWSNPADRAACCARMANHCATVSADDCCEKGEQRRTRDLTRSVAQPALDMTPGAIVAPLVLIERETDVLILLARPRPHLLHEVFLI